MTVRGSTVVVLLAALTIAPLFGPLFQLAGAEERWHQRIKPAGPAEVTVEGSPTSDDEVYTHLRVEDRSATVTLRETPAGLLPGSAGGDQLARASPTGPVDARLELEAGPVQLSGPGSVSPAFPLKARASVDAEDGVDRAWLRVDEQIAAELDPAGRAEDRDVFVGSLGAHHLPADRSPRVDVVFDREPTPATTQRLEGPGWTVRTDDEGPDPPKLRVEEGQVRMEEAPAEVRAQTRSEEGSWEPARVEDGTVLVPDEPGTHQVRARGVDGVGNEGPWSDPVEVVDATRSRPTQPDPWRLVSPDDGSTVQGAVPVAWRPANATSLVQVDARPGPQDTWRSIGEAGDPPITWRTGFVTDGDWQLRIRAHTNGSWETRLVNVTVDNLDESSHPTPPAARGQASGPDGLDPRTASPMGRALASGAALVALAGGAVRAWTGRPK